MAIDFIYINLFSGRVKPAFFYCIKKQIKHKIKLSKNLPALLKRPPLKKVALFLCSLLLIDSCHLDTIS